MPSISSSPRDHLTQARRRRCADLYPSSKSNHLRGGSLIDINGMAHVILTVSQYDKAKAFYLRLMSAMGLETVFDNEGLTYFVGARTAVGIQPCKPECGHRARARRIASYLPACAFARRRRQG